jgi:DNA-binding beta-propeller fold protein YncE
MRLFCDVTVPSLVPSLTSAALAAASVVVLTGCSALDGGSDGLPSCLEAPRARPLLHAMLLSNLDPFDPFGTPVSSAIEVVDLETHELVRTLQTGEHFVSSIAVSPDGLIIYLARTVNSEIAVVDGKSGSQLASIPVTFPQDLALSADGTRLYATAADSFLAIDAYTGVVTSTLPTGGDVPLGLSLSPDGTRLGAPGTFGGTDAAYYLVNAVGPLSPVSRIALADQFPGCATMPTDSVFTDGGRALLWDSNCDAIYQIDVNAAAQLTGATIALGRDIGGFFNFNNMITYSAAVGRAYVAKESVELAIVNPVAASATLHGGFGGAPFVLAQTPAGDAEYVAVLPESGGANTLTRADTATGTLQHGVYTFSDPTKDVRDMRIVVAAP